MRAAYVTGYGNSDLIEVRNVSIPNPKSNELLIEVKASTVTQADVMMLSGKPYFARLFVGFKKPKHPIPGTGFSGIIREVGEDVTDFKVGEEVFGETTLGFSTNAEFVVISESGVLLRKPKNMSHEEAATYGDGPVTSLNFLKNIGKIKKGQQVLINGASGALGTAAVQLASYFGAKVTAVCSGKNANLVKKLGADNVIDYKTSDFTKSNERYDLIFDTVGKSSFCESRKVLKRKGKFVSPVLTFSLLYQSLISRLFFRKKATFAATGMKKNHELKEMFEELLVIREQFDFQVVIDREFKLEEVSKAHEFVAMGHKVGNVILQLN